MTRHETNRNEVVERYWPYDGPHDTDSVIDAALAVRDLVRYLNNATSGSALRYPSDLYTVAAATALSVQRTNQLCDQLAAQLTVDADYAAGIYDDRFPDDDPAPTMRQAATVLWECQEDALALGEKLDNAAQLLSHLGLDDEQNQPEAGSFGPEAP